MMESEWGDRFSTSEEDDDSPSYKVDRTLNPQQAADIPSDFSCICSNCVDYKMCGGAVGAPSGAPESGRISGCSRACRTSHASVTDNNSSGYAEGVPVPVMMLQYPLFFCDVDLPFTLELKRSWREIGGLAFWTLSSAKEGNGMEALRDNSSQTFWQSEGQAPHTITLQFNKEIKITRVDLLVNLQQDESYTPKRVQIKLGSSPFTLHIVRDVEFALAEEQNCWWGIELTPVHAIKLVNGLENQPHDVDFTWAGVDTSEFLRGACIQIAVITTHQQGRDTHIRQVRVYGPTEGAEDAEPCTREPATSLPSRHTTSAMHEEAMYGLDLISDAAQTPPLNPRLTSDFPGLNRAWSQDFLAALAGTQPP